MSSPRTPRRWGPARASRPARGACLAGRSSLVLLSPLAPHPGDVRPLRRRRGDGEGWDGRGEEAPPLGDQDRALAPGVREGARRHLRGAAQGRRDGGRHSQGVRAARGRLRARAHEPLLETKSRTASSRSARTSSAFSRRWRRRRRRRGDRLVSTREMVNAMIADTTCGAHAVLAEDLDVDLGNLRGAVNGEKKELARRRAEAREEEERKRVGGVRRRPLRGRARGSSTRSWAGTRRWSASFASSFAAASPTRASSATPRGQDGHRRGPRAAHRRSGTSPSASKTSASSRYSSACSWRTRSTAASSRRG